MIDAKRAAELLRDAVCPEEDALGDFGVDYNDAVEAVRMAASALERLPALLQLVEKARAFFIRTDESDEAWFAALVDRSIEVRNALAGIPEEPPR